MRKKLISKTYLRDVESYTQTLYMNNEDFFVSVKHLIKTKPFHSKDGLPLMKNGYFLVEVIPKFEHYAMRAFMNDKKEVVEYYFDISLGNGIDEETKVPYYDDLFTDIIVDDKGKIRIVDENELAGALECKLITNEQYALAKSVTKTLYDEISKGINKYQNMDLKQFIK